MIVNGFPRGVKIYTDQVSGLAVSAVANTPGSLIISWTQPSSKLYKGVTLVYKTGSYPTSPTDGTVVYVAKGTVTKTITGLTGGTTYYVRAFAKATNTSGSKVYYNTTTTGAQAGRATIASPVTNFVIAAVANSPDKLTFSLSAPSGAYDGVMIRYKAGSYPTSQTDGTQHYYGKNTSGTIGGLTGGTQYYFRAFVYNSDNAVNSDTAQQAKDYTVPSPVSNLAVAKTSPTSLTVTWSLPAGAYSNIYIKRKAGSYPTEADGGIIYTGLGTSIVDTGLASGTTYYYRAFVINSAGNYNTSTSQQANNATKAAAGQVVLTSSQTWTIPAGVRLVDIFLVGGGGGSAYGSHNDLGTGTILGAAGAPGGGYTTTRKGLSCTPGSAVVAVIGAGGERTRLVTTGGEGGTSSITISGTTYSAIGGKAPVLGNNGDWFGANGGSGGGGGIQSSDNKSYSGAGGSDGSDGSGAVSNGQADDFYRGGEGQGSTTRAFADAGGILYAGGGGGCYRSVGTTTGYPGAGGAGGGGKGGYAWKYQAVAGTPNTGGGAGSAVAEAQGDYTWRSVKGGSGVVIIRWAEQ